MLRYISSFALITVLVLAGCSEDDPSESISFDRESMLKDMTGQVILPAFETFSTRANDLSSAVQALHDAPTLSSLEQSQDAWMAAANAYKRAEMFMMGPMDQLSAAAMLNNWPTNTVGIEEELEATTPIDAAYIQQLGSTRKGFPALEYLLFDWKSGNESVLDRLNSDERSLDFALALANDIERLAESLENGWAPEGDNYAEVFESATGTNAASSMNVLANEMVKLTEVVKNLKIGVPLGKRSMGVLLPENVEARFSARSVELALNNLDAIEAVYSGNNQAFDSYHANLEAVGAMYGDEPLGDVILAEIATLRQSLLAIDQPLQTAVETDYNTVEQAYNSSQRLVVLLKTDMISSLGLLITFTDNDGD